MIPARYAASRFPGKLMQDLGGKTVILNTYLATVKTGLFNAVYVVTDSHVIYDEIVTNGGKAIMSQKEHECGSDRIAEAVADLDIDIVINVQGDEPFTSAKPLEQLLRVFKEDTNNEIDLASIKTPITNKEDIENPNCVKVITDTEERALYFSRSPIPYPRDTKIQHTYYKHVGIYAFRKQAILDFYTLPMQALEASEKIECIRFLEYGKTIKMVTSTEITFGIDTPEDLIKANQYLKTRP